MRVHIVGSPGSGKSTLARTLAARLGTAPVDLDELLTDRTPDQLRAECARIARRPAWVVEGIYCGWTNALLDGADAVVWLDLPAYVAAYRILRRHVRNSRSGEQRHPGIRRLAGFTYRATWRYARAPAATGAELDADPAANSRATVAERLRPYAGKVAHARTRADVRRIAAGISASGR